MSNPLEDPFYYLHNFQQVLDWLGQRYADVLDDEEQRFIAQFSQVPQPDQSFLVRSVMRKGLHCHASELIYN